MIRRRRFLLSLLLGCLLVAAPALAQPAGPVDLELALLVDVSGSISAAEYNLQKTGYVNAFTNPALWNAISQGAIGKIAVAYIEWSGSTQQSTLVNWTIIDSQASALAFSAAIQASTRAFSGQTGVGAALTFGTNSILQNGITSTRQILDISGDGCNNSGVEASVGRAFALANGIDVINGLVIQPNNACEHPNYATLLPYYQNEVITANGFVQVANDFADFEAALDAKLIKEIQGTVPEPISMVLMGTGLAGIGAMRRRRRKQNED